MLARITGMPGSRIFLLLALPAVFAVSAGAPTWSIRTSGIDANLRGVSAPGDGHEGSVWVSGTNGVVMVSTDQGKQWKRLPIEGGENLDFRALVAFSEWRALEAHRLRQLECPDCRQIGRVSGRSERGRGAF
jgi:hypothetical protein